MRSMASHSVAPAAVLATAGVMGAEPRSRMRTWPTPAPSQTRRTAPRLRGSCTSSNRTMKSRSGTRSTRGSPPPPPAAARPPRPPPPALSAAPVPNPAPAPALDTAPPPTAPPPAPRGTPPRAAPPPPPAPLPAPAPAAPPCSSAAMPLCAGPATAASTRSGTTSNATRCRWQRSSISSRRRPARVALIRTLATMWGRWRSASRTGW
jgi:protein TonB